MAELVTLLFGVGIGLAAAAALRGLGAISFPGERISTADPDAPYGWDPRPERDTVPSDGSPSDRPREIAELVERPAEGLVPRTPSALPRGGEPEGEPAATEAGALRPEPQQVRLARDLLFALSEPSGTSPPGPVSLGRSPESLAESLGRSGPALGRLIEQLLAAGVLREVRGPAPARRSYRLSSAGEELVRRLRAGPAPGS